MRETQKGMADPTGCDIFKNQEVNMRQKKGDEQDRKRRGGQKRKLENTTRNK